MKNRGTGAGGANTNAYGLRFEDSILGHLKNGQEYEFGDTKLRFFTKTGFLNEMLDLKNPEFKHSKQPDGVYMTKDKKTLFILELKHQTESGSVDEKLMTGPGLIHHYKTLYPEVQDVHLCYIVNGWFFRQKKFDITVSFLKKYDIPIFYAENTMTFKLKIKNGKKWSDCMVPVEYFIDHSIIHEWITSKL